MKPAPSQAVSKEDLGPLRQQIDKLDQELVKIFNERSHVANKIGHVKQQLGLPVYDPAREKEVLENVIRANPGPLPPDAIQRLFERVIDETRSLERQKYQRRTKR